MASLSDTVVKIRLDKCDRNQWGKCSAEKNPHLKPDIDAHWSDYEEEDDEDLFEYGGVHPDNEHIPELDVECIGDLEDHSE